MRAQEVMTKGVVTVAPGTAATDAWQLMQRRQIHHLIVRDMSGFVGVLSDRDLGGRQAPSVTAGRSVADLMTPRVVTVDATATVKKIANVMRGRSIGCVVVTDGGRAVGLITVSDLLELVGRGAERPIPTTTRHGLHYRTPHRRKRLPSGVW